MGASERERDCLGRRPVTVHNHMLERSCGLRRQTHSLGLYFLLSLLLRFLNDQEISDGGNFILGEKESVYRLDIGSVDSDLVGKIKVTAENENGKDEKQVILLSVS